MELMVAFSCGFVCCAVLAGLMYHIIPKDTTEPQPRKTSFFAKADRPKDPNQKSVIVLDQKHEDELEAENE